MPPPSLPSPLKATPRRSEKRRVGEKGRTRGGPDHLKKKKRSSKLPGTKAKSTCQYDYSILSTTGETRFSQSPASPTRSIYAPRSLLTVSRQAYGCDSS